MINMLGLRLITRSLFRFARSIKINFLWGAFQIVASVCWMWSVRTPTTLFTLAGVLTSQRQFEMHPLLSYIQLNENIRYTFANTLKGLGVPLLGGD